jgi:ATP-dependent Lon protease
VGGDRSTSILKGFRRTYIGAIPGKIIQGLREVKVSNPLILIDEVDKLTERSIHGDPSSVLLEILDPEQNTTFVDDFIDLPVDLSKVLFICTANTLSTIPRPLLDRMEVIEVSGYTHAEKKHILDQYLFPQEMEKAGVTERQKEFKVTDDAKKEMIENYCRTPGVRELQKSLRRIMEKVAYKIVKGETNLEINNKNLEDYIGNPPFYPDRIYPQTPPVPLS